MHTVKSQLKGWPLRPSERTYVKENAQCSTIIFKTNYFEGNSQCSNMHVKETSVTSKRMYLALQSELILLFITNLCDFKTKLCDGNYECSNSCLRLVVGLNIEHTRLQCSQLISDMQVCTRVAKGDLVPFI